MFSFPARTWRACALAVFFFFPAISSAQSSKLDDASLQVAERLKPLGPNLVAVADFASPDGTASAQSHYLAWYLSASLQERGKKRFHVAEHKAFDKDLANILGPGAAALTSLALRDAAPRIGANIVVIGTVVKRKRSYVLEITPVQVSTGSPVDTVNTSMEATGFLDSLATPLPAKDSEPELKPGVGDVTMPRCISCPEPSYTKLARTLKIQGSVLFVAIISPDGQAHQVRPESLLGYGLDEEAYNAIRKWRFKPATRRKDGTPVDSLVPIEVTFRY